ncbi:MAG: dipeptide epimerase [Elusimicrobia bacterium]|nr:dipeptide epimerase [Elusimicrobiota bacterium]
MLKIKSFSLNTFETALKRPFITALGRKDSSVNVGLTLELSDGSRGYGEASSSLALAHLSAGCLAKTMKALTLENLGEDLAGAGSIIDKAWKTHGRINPAAAAFECALWQAVLASMGMPMAEWLGGALRKVETDITLSAWGEPTATRQAAQEARNEGFGIFKVKVGGELQGDLERVRLAHEAGPKARLILDGNQSLSEKGALKLVEACLAKGWPVELLEQPLGRGQFAQMAALSRRCPVPVAADEMVKTPEDAARVAGEGAAHVINIKVAKSGIRRSLEIAAIARGAGLGLMIGCMTETAEGLAPSVHLALGTGFFKHVDLDSDHLLGPHPEASSWKRRGPLLSLD